VSAVLFAACLVIGVADGDTLRVQCEGRRAAFQVRINQIDAPELAHKAFGIAEQPLGKESKAELTALCLKKPATVRRVGFDQHRRAIGDVSCAGADVATHQVRAGMAWAYTAYLVKGSKMPALEAEARAAGRGVWSEDLAVPPWEWRKRSAAACS
jgi:endonuclease YncB( thermonuclease family)